MKLTSATGLPHSSAFACLGRLSRLSVQRAFVMIARSLLPFLAFAVPSVFGQSGIYGPVMVHPKAGDPAPDLAFTKTLSFPVSDSWSPSNLSGQLTVLAFFPDTTDNLQSVTLWNAEVDKFVGKPIEFVWITGEPESTLKPWLQQHPIKGWVLYDPEGKTGKTYGIEMPANVIIGADGRIVGYFMGFPEIDDLVQAIQDGRITTTRPSQAAFKAFNESKKVLVEAEAPRMPRAEDHKPSFPPSFTVHVSPSQGEEHSNSSSDDYLALQGFTLKEAIELLYDINPIRVQLPASLENDRHYDFSLLLPEQESQEQMKERIRIGLRNYFQLNVRHENRLVDVYVLSLSSNGKLPPTKSPVYEGMGGETVSSVTFEPPSGRVEAMASTKPQPIDAIRGASANATADEFCHTLEFTLDRPVVNETNLKGEFEFRIEDGKGAENDFLERLRDQLGLVITPAQRIVETLVIEHR
jgi:uncharacterized protein (TIGR03435 family)